MKEIPEEPILLDVDQLKLLQRERKWPDSWWVSVNNRIEASPVSLGTAVTLKKAYPQRHLYVANVEDRGIPQEWIELSREPTRTPWPYRNGRAPVSSDKAVAEVSPPPSPAVSAEGTAVDPVRPTFRVGPKTVVAALLVVVAGVAAWIFNPLGKSAAPTDGATIQLSPPTSPPVATPLVSVVPPAPAPIPSPVSQPAPIPTLEVIPPPDPLRLLSEARAAAKAASDLSLKLRVEDLAPETVGPLLSSETRAKELEAKGDVSGAASAWNRLAEGRSRAALAAATKAARQALDALSLENIRDYESVHWAAIDSAMARAGTPGNLLEAAAEVGKVPALAELLRADLGSQLSAQALRFEKEKKLPLARRSWLSVLRLAPANPAALRFLNSHLREPGPAHTNSLGANFHFVPAGSFRRGSPAAERGRDSDESSHTVTLTRAFLLGRHEVTVAEWRRVMGADPASKANASGQAAPLDSPVAGVSWRQAVDFCERLSKLENRRYRLPTEAEWEYACRAGTNTAWPTGDEEPGRDTAEFAQPGIAPTPFPSPVGALGKPNAWGLCGMCGGVWEWCQDWSANYPTQTVTDPTGPKDNELDPVDSLRVLRGGSWMDPAVQGRSANRFEAAPAAPPRSAGLRVVLEIGPEHFPSLIN